MYWLSKTKATKESTLMALTKFKSVHPIDYYIVGGNLPQSTDLYHYTLV